MTIRLAGLYIITPPFLFNNENLDSQQLNLYLAKIEIALKSGARILQFRDKSEESGQRMRLAERLFELCQSYKCVFIINDDIKLAASLGAHGVHLGKDDATINLARNVLGEQALIGVSCYNQLHLAYQAQEQGADYVAFGRFFPSRTKPTAVQAEIELIQQAKTDLHLPVVAIGGIDQNNARQLVAAGADSLAVSAGIFDHSNISSATKRIIASFEQ